MIFEFGGITYAMEKKLVKKLDIMIKRITTSRMEQNVYLGNHGLPGEGKTNASLGEALYVKMNTNRQIHLFFSTNNALNFAKNHDKKIIIVDEPSLDNMSSDQASTIAKNFSRLYNMARIKRHFMIVNLTKFWRFPRDLTCDAFCGMVHLDSKDGTSAGQFKYIRGKKLELLYNDYQRFGRKRYAHYMSFGGRMPHIKKEDFIKLGLTIEGIPNATYDDYERLKNEAIGSIGEPKEKIGKLEQNQINKIRELRGKFINFARLKGLTVPEIARHLGITQTSVYNWQNGVEIDPISLGNSGLEGQTPAT